MTNIIGFNKTKSYVRNWVYTRIKTTFNILNEKDFFELLKIEGKREKYSPFISYVEENPGWCIGMFSITDKEAFILGDKRLNKDSLSLEYALELFVDHEYDGIVIHHIPVDTEIFDGIPIADNDIN